MTLNFNFYRNDCKCRRHVIYYFICHGLLTVVPHYPSYNDILGEIYMLTLTHFD